MCNSACEHHWYKIQLLIHKRQLWTFKLTVYDCDDGQTYCYLCHEGLAARGANEIGSCVYKFILEDVKEEVKSDHVFRHMQRREYEYPCSCYVHCSITKLNSFWKK